MRKIAIRGPRYMALGSLCSTAQPASKPAQNAPTFTTPAPHTLETPSNAVRRVCVCACSGSQVLWPTLSQSLQSRRSAVVFELVASTRHQYISVGIRLSTFWLRDGSQLSPLSRQLLSVSCHTHRTHAEIRHLDGRIDLSAPHAWWRRGACRGVRAGCSYTGVRSRAQT
jgi:hypothetical protein